MTTVVLGRQLDSMILKIFQNLNDSIILCLLTHLMFVLTEAASRDPEVCQRTTEVVHPACSVQPSAQLFAPLLKDDNHPQKCLHGNQILLPKKW